MNTITLEEQFKTRIKQELVEAIDRFNNLDTLYKSSKKINGLPETYVEYLQRERDLAYMMYQAKNTLYKQFI